MKNPDLDPIFENEKRWKPEINLLRELVLETELSEEKKWFQPVYTWNGKNVAIIGRFKDFCTLSFFKGELLKDPAKILVSPGENSQIVKMFKFTDIQEIKANNDLIKTYLLEAIEIEKSGKKVAKKSIEEYEIPAELSEFFKQNKNLEFAFKKLTPGRQRQYLMHFSSAKQTATRIARIEKFTEKILSGKGMND